MSLAIIVLAAGKGTRMESDLAKVLHPLCGRPLVAWVLEATAPLEAERTVVVVGHQAESVESQVCERFPGMEFARQTEMLGTGHAVQQAQAALADFEGDILVLCGDAPLVETATLRRMIQQRHETGAAAIMMVAHLDEPGSYGRVICDADGRVSRVVEKKDAGPEELAVQIVNAGAYCFDSKHLWAQLARIGNSNKSGEYYLTDIVALLADAGEGVFTAQVDPREMTGINTRAELTVLDHELGAQGVRA